MFDERSVQKMLSIMNQHLPVSKRSITELLAEKDPSYLAKDGHVYRFDRRELEHLASLLNDLDRPRLRLPILIMSDTGYEGGAWKVTGKIEVKVIAALLEREPESETEMRLFFPHLHQLRKSLPTTTTVMYAP